MYGLNKTELLPLARLFPQGNERSRRRTQAASQHRCRKRQHDATHNSGRLKTPCRANKVRSRPTQARGQLGKATAPPFKPTMRRMVLPSALDWPLVKRSLRQIALTEVTLRRNRPLPTANAHCKQRNVHEKATRTGEERLLARSRRSAIAAASLRSRRMPLARSRRDRRAPRRGARPRQRYIGISKVLRGNLSWCPSPYGRPPWSHTCP